MRNAKTTERPLRNPEVVLNLWAYAGADGYVLRLAGKAYVMDGNDEDNLALLRQLSAADFLSAPWQKVPANFSMTNPDGEVMKGIAHASMLADTNSQGFLFGPLMEQLAKELPEQLRSIDGDYMPFRFELPQDPLAVMTVVIEHEDGRLVPMVSAPNAGRAD
jgi:hypothetical protein